MLIAMPQQMYQTPGNMSRYSLSPDRKLPCARPQTGRVLISNHPSSLRGRLL